MSRHSRLIRYKLHMSVNRKTFTTTTDSPENIYHTNSISTLRYSRCTFVYRLSISFNTIQPILCHKQMCFVALASSATAVAKAIDPEARMVDTLVVFQRSVVLIYLCEVYSILDHHELTFLSCVFCSGNTICGASRTTTIHHSRHCARART